MRKIEIHSEKNMMESEAIKEAFTYLATWGQTKDADTTAKIYDDGKKDLIASYWTENGSRIMTIGAVWRESSNEFTFHS